jgi:predicted ATPase
VTRPLRKPLPAQATTFVGRAAELAQIEEAIARGARLVTLLGPPGIGKSRLAHRYAELELEGKTYPGGIFACDLVDAATAEDLCAAMSRTIDAVVDAQADVRTRGSDRVAQVGVAIAGRGDALFVLDNVERLASVGPETIGRWLKIAGRARFLVTSREKLRLAGETVFEVGPLSMPEGGRDIAQAEAAQLFIERARAARPNLSISPENEETIAAIVRELDGIPLAIELGASRMAVLTPAQLLERMPRRFEVLSAGLRNPTARQRTLREAIDTSYRMLQPHEQAALAQVSVFRGGFSLEAAEAVVDLSASASPSASAPPVLDVLEALADRSLLFTRQPASAPDEIRFDLYRSIREFAASRLAEAPGEAAALARHAAYFLAAAEAWSDPPDQPESPGQARLALERENLIAVHDHMLSLPTGGAKDAEGPLRAALALESVLARWGPVSTLLSMLDAALASEAAVKLLPRALHLRGVLARASANHLLGRLDESRTGYEAALALAEAAKDARSHGIAEAGVGAILREQGRLKEAERRLTSAIKTLQRARASLWEGRARIPLGHIFTVTGKVDEARAHYERALSLLRAGGDRELSASGLLSLGMVCVAEGRHEEAEAAFNEARASVREPASPDFKAGYHRMVAYLRQDQGLLAEARASLEASISIVRALGNSRVEGFTLGNLGTIFAEIGDLVQARAAFERSVELLAQAGDARASALFTAALGATRARLGHLIDAAKLLRAAEEHLEGVGDPVLSAGVDLYGLELELARAARFPLADAREQAIAAVKTKAEAIARTSAPRSHNVRIAYRLLERSMAELRPAPQPGAPASPAAGDRPAPAPSSPSLGGAPSQPTSRVLVASPDARWCRLPDGTEVTFTKSRALRLMLLRLFDERLSAPDRALSIAALFESGWPGERASTEAIENRVYVGLSRLRKMGFKGLLLSRDDGFLLDPTVPAYRAEKPL